MDDMTRKGKRKSMIVDGRSEAGLGLGLIDGRWYIVLEGRLSEWGTRISEILGAVDD